ncbi:hypothetical protein [Alteromonas sp. BMJM2]|uniref:hypothetical protein n=1 Tax=Alteromonas sp. BMJM2 TaxID=2954241 RepID=UPI003FA4768A
MGNYDGNSQFSTWLHSVTANVTITYMRKLRSLTLRLMLAATSRITSAMMK